MSLESCYKHGITDVVDEGGGVASPWPELQEWGGTMAASPARLIAAARHLKRMQDHRQWEIDQGIPLDLRIPDDELAARTMDPADALITSLLLNREFKVENPDHPESIADRAIEQAKRRSRRAD